MTLTLDSWSVLIVDIDGADPTPVRIIVKRILTGIISFLDNDKISGERSESASLTC
ncbi:MAG: hypothetical protein QMD92_07505 [bacterium]|nr:hypothetical protein [bacterium]